MTNQGLSLFQEGHCHWQKTFNGNNAKRPTKQNKTNIPKKETKQKTVRHLVKNPAILLMEDRPWKWRLSRGNQLNTSPQTVLFI